MFPLSGSVILVVCRWAGHVRFPQSCIRKEHTEPATIGNVYTSLYTLLYEMPGVRWPLWTHRVTCAPNCPPVEGHTHPCHPKISPHSHTFLHLHNLLYTPSLWTLSTLNCFPTFFLFSHVIPRASPARNWGILSFSNLISPPSFFSDEFFSSLPAFPL